MSAKLTERVGIRHVIGRISDDGVEAVNTANGMTGRGKTLIEAYADLNKQEFRAALQKHNEPASLRGGER